MGLSAIELPVELLAVLKTRRAHPLRRANGLHRLGGLGNQKRAELAAEESAGVKRLELFSFAQIETLADVDECRHRRDSPAPAFWRPKHRCAARPRSAAGHIRCASMYWWREWRMKPRSPAVYVRINVPRSITEAIFSSPCEILIPSTAVSMLGTCSALCWKAVPCLERRISLRIERLRVRHSAGHPEDDQRVGRRRSFQRRRAAVLSPNERAARRPPGPQAWRRWPLEKITTVGCLLRFHVSHVLLSSSPGDVPRSVDQLKLRQHEDRPEQIFHALLLGRRSDDLLAGIAPSPAAGRGPCAAERYRDKIAAGR